MLSIVFQSSRWRKIPQLQARLKKAATATLDHLPQSLHFPVSVTLLLTTDAAIRRLNRDFRGKDKPTNVLSFPQFEPTDLRQFRHTKTPVEIGDIVIAYQYMVGEAKLDHKILINHVIHLFIHGLLHLFGYDHLLDPEAMHMERLETKIMAALDLPDPYRTADPMEPKPRRKAAQKRRTAVRSKR